MTDNEMTFRIAELAVQLYGIHKNDIMTQDANGEHVCEKHWNMTAKYFIQDDVNALKEANKKNKVC